MVGAKLTIFSHLQSGIGEAHGFLGCLFSLLTVHIVNSCSCRSRCLSSHIRLTVRGQNCFYGCIRGDTNGRDSPFKFRVYSSHISEWSSNLIWCRLQSGHISTRLHTVRQKALFLLAILRTRLSHMVSTLFGCD